MIEDMAKMIKGKEIEPYYFGWNVSYDGDNYKTLYGTTCNRCDRYFESAKADIYCEECKKGKL